MLPLLLTLALAPSPLDARLDTATAKGEPLTALVIVALADNANQGIVPVPAALGDGDDARNNLYWGARYGLKTFLTRDAGWRIVDRKSNPTPLILERLTLERRDRRGGERVTLRVVAEAWRGSAIKAATRAFLADEADTHLRVYVGHNGLMDFSLPAGRRAPAAPQGEIVLACASDGYFRERLSRPALLTASLLAPEGYVVDAALRAALTGRDPEEAAARAYAKYQKISRRSARRVFTR